MTRGCFEGSLEEFELAVKETHEENKYAKTYRIVVELIKNRLEKWTELKKIFLKWMNESIK